MYELKNIKHGERPVTGSDSRDKVGDFFTKRVQQQDTPVANVDDVEEHRPQQVSFSSYHCYCGYKYIPAQAMVVYWGGGGGGSLVF